MAAELALVAIIVAYAWSTWRLAGAGWPARRSHAVGIVMRTRTGGSDGPRISDADRSVLRHVPGVRRAVREAVRRRAWRRSTSSAARSRSCSSSISSSRSCARSSS